MTTSAVTPAVVPVRARFAKSTLWLAMGAMVLSVLVLTELPMLRPGPRHSHLFLIRWLIVPHALAGMLALLIGPVQFSSRVRRRWLRLHRLLGRIYVGSVFVASALAIAMIIYSHFKPVLFVANVVQSGAWSMVTLAALLTARNRHIVQHRQWMIRSYAITFTFILLRVPRPLHMWSANVTGDMSGVSIIVATFLAVLVPDIAFQWRELTTRRT